METSLPTKPPTASKATTFDVYSLIKCQPLAMVLKMTIEGSAK